MKTASLRLRALVAWVLTAAALLTGLFTAVHWDALWGNGNLFISSTYYRAMSDRVDQAVSLGELLCIDEETLTFLDQERIAQLTYELLPENTNLRFSLHTADGKRLSDNTGGLPVHDVANGVSLYSFTVRISSDGLPAYQSLVLEYGMAKTLTAADVLSDFVADYALLQRLLPFLALAALLCVTAATVAAVWLGLGLRKTDKPLKKPPFDLLFLLLFLAVGMTDNLARPALFSFFAAPWKLAPLLASAVFCALWAALGLVGLAAFVYQWRRGLWKNCLTARLCAYLWGKLRQAVRALRLSRRPALAFLIYLSLSLLLGLLLYSALFNGSGDWFFSFLLFALFQGLSLRFFLRMDQEQRAAMAETVEREIRAQRFQAELITNVSHDLRSPLTSLINYVDLLKKAGPGSPDAAEYLDVLERKSQRLKKLTDDLIEASKASSGVLPVNLEPLGLKELAQQALAEYGDRFEAAGLTLVMSAPEEEIAVTADGRHLWRVLDNLLSNCAKYSLPGSRVYLAISAEGGQGVVTLKNVSAESLNIPADELMSRFVRGDHSRTDGGSGLGLSIADSLTKLQHGTFTLDIDGDLFKATVSLPLAPPPAETLPNEDAAHE